MAAFQGTQTKCKVCSKTVYLMEQLIADGVIYHKACFRCSHCKGTLQLNSFASLEGVLYCKPHFEQLFKKTGSYDKSFDEAIKAEKEKPAPQESIAGGSAPKIKEEKVKQTNPLASRFGGTQEKCKVCSKTVYPLEKVSVENTTYHNFCFKCVHAGCKLTTATYRALHGKLYCKHHFNQLFLIKGNYSTLTSENGAGTPGATGSEGGEEEATAAAAAPAPTPASPSPAKTVATPPAPSATPTPAKKVAAADSDDSDSDSDDDKPPSKPPVKAPAPAPAPAAKPVASSSAAPASVKKPAAPPPKAAPAKKKDDSDSDSDSSDSDSDSDDD